MLGYKALTGHTIGSTVSKYRVTLNASVNEFQFGFNDLAQL